MNTRQVRDQHIRVNCFIDELNKQRYRLDCLVEDNANLDTILGQKAIVNYLTLHLSKEQDQLKYFMDILDDEDEERPELSDKMKGFLAKAGARYNDKG